jgi:hypothetical protein
MFVIKCREVKQVKKFLNFLNLVRYDRGSLLTKKLMSQGFQMSGLQAAFRKFYGRYNDLIYPYNLSLGHMLSDMFHNNR